MSHYGILATHWNVSFGDIDEVQLHKIVSKGGGRFGLSPAELVWCTDVANLIDAGHTVWVIVAEAQGKYRNTDRVQVDTKDGGRKSLYSCAEDGTPTSALTNLPRYIRPDDPLSDSARELLAKAKHGVAGQYPILTQRAEQLD
jgi:hypothetical protein